MTDEITPGAHARIVAHARELLAAKDAELAGLRSTAAREHAARLAAEERRAGQAPALHPIFDEAGHLPTVACDGLLYTAADLVALRTLLTYCQEQRLLIRDVEEAAGAQAREHAEQRARHHWRGLAAFLETLALNVPAPGAALAVQLATLRDERDQARGRADQYVKDVLGFQLQMLQMAETLREVVQAETIEQWVGVQDHARRQVEQAAPRVEPLAALIAAVGVYLSGPGAVEHERLAAAYDAYRAGRAAR